MKKMSYWGQPFALFALVLSAVGSLMAPATAVPSTTTDNSMQQSAPTSLQRQNNMQLAQVDLVGQCRAAKQRIPVYRQPSSTSPADRILTTNERVTLADNGNGRGWIRISSPIAGFVEAANLTSCSGVAVNPTPRPTPQPTPQPTSSLCRVVTYNGPEGGLAIRSRPDRSAPRVDGVKLGDRVTLRTSPPPSTLDTEGRDWVEVTAPTRGWISNGFPRSRSANIGTCP